MRFDLFTRLLMPVFFTLLYWGISYGQTNVTNATVGNLTVTKKFEAITPDATNLISTAGQFTRKVGIPFVDGAGNQITIGIQDTAKNVIRNAAVQGFIHDTNAWGLKFQTMDKNQSVLNPLELRGNSAIFSGDANLKNGSLTVANDINITNGRLYLNAHSITSDENGLQFWGTYGRLSMIDLFTNPQNDITHLVCNSGTFSFQGANTIKMESEVTITEDLTLEKDLKIKNWTLRQIPDYVFDSSYALKPLHEVEKFVKENRHLPDIPSAAQIVKNGVDLNEMNMLLLKKIEELTLYTIDQQKKTEELTHYASEQQKQIDELRTIVKENKKGYNDK